MEANTPDTASMEAALTEAKRIAGGNVGLAKEIGSITPQAVSQWKCVPPKQVIAVERVTGIPRHVLRPDVFPAPHSTPEHQEAAQ